MVHQPKSISPTTSIRDAAEILSKEEFHALPITQDGELLGIITTTDVIKYLLEQY